MQGLGLMTATGPAWVRFEQLDSQSVRLTLLDASFGGIEGYPSEVKRAVGTRPLGLAAVHPWLDGLGLETTGEWLYEQGAFVSRVQRVQTGR